MENGLTAMRKTHTGCCVTAVAGALSAVRQKTANILICRGYRQRQFQKNIHRW